MELGLVVGSVWATKKSEALKGQTFLVIRPLKQEEPPSRRLLVAADVVGAGTGDTVLLTTGSGARAALGPTVPVDAAVVGIVDSLELDPPDTGGT